MSAPLPPPSCPETSGSIARIWRGEARYPDALEDLRENAPRQLTARGRLELLDVQPRVAIVGTRRATGYGLRVTRELGAAFARAGACVVSGLALGIDGAAHQGALEAGGATIAVLGTGLDAVFPRANRALQARIASDGLLLSELEPLEHGTKWTFPERNRIIAALSAVTIVVEAPHKSGALITADCAEELGRTVAVIPGPIDQPQSAGSNRLLRDGRLALVTIEDALALVGLTPPPRAPRGDPRGNEGRVWAALAGGGLDMDTLCLKSGLPAAQCMAAVTTLELHGSVECAITGEIRRR
ncbi:MAG: DNA-processing protein DprA [Gemmatimonadaceae bacterium]